MTKQEQIERRAARRVKQAEKTVAREEAQAAQTIERLGGAQEGEGSENETA